MVRSIGALAFVVALGISLPAVVFGQVGGPPQGQNPNAPRQPGPSAQDILRLFIPPEDQYDDGNDGPQYSQRGTESPSRPTEQLHIPTTAEVTQMSAHQQRASLRQALARLDADLDKQSTGAAWKTHLQTGELGSALWCRPESEPEPDVDSRRTLRAIAVKFAEVQQNPKFRVIHALPGFQLARAVLPEYATGAAEKSQRSLRVSSATLADSLGRINTGANWKQFLQVEELQRRAKQGGEPQPADADVLQLIGEKFDEVEKNPKFKKVAIAPGFAKARADVKQMVAALKKDQAFQAQRAAATAPTRPDASQLERMVASLMADLEAMKHHCAEESEAKHVLTLADQAAEKPGTGNTVELVRKAQDANDVLRQIKERHDQSVREAEARLQKIMKLVQAGSTKQVEGKSVMILPLGVDQPEGETVEILPLGVDQPKDNSAVIMPLGTEPKDPKEPSEKPKTYQ